tara:strand:+ start:117564 stop:117956 length:393 start_codon:yes stop_codon:yes gene_type:complete
MKRLIILSLSILFLACSTEDNTDVQLAGTWKLIEVLADPRDGSGTYTPVDSDKTITFFSNGTIKSNGYFCASNSNQDNEGVYSLESFTINVKDCGENNIQSTIRFGFEKNRLILNFQCFEACGAKFKKVN